MFFGADVGETLTRAVSQTLTGLSDGISGQEGRTHGVLMPALLGLLSLSLKGLSSGVRN